MHKRFRYAVIGRGLLGAAAARHLANLSEGVALIGPGEPSDLRSHHGVFGSHYDEGRITRTIDPDPVWAELSQASIARYRAIEAATGISFFREVGALLTGAGHVPGGSYVADTLRVASLADVKVRHLDRQGLARDFPWFAFPEGTEGVFEASGAGHVSPRKLVRAQSQLAEHAGAEIIDCAVTAVRVYDGRVGIGTVDGDIVEADAVLVATGGFMIQKNLLPEPLHLSVYARTVAFFEVSAEEAARLSTMPSMIHKAEKGPDDIYLLPPICYPDGRFYLKVGGDPVDTMLEGHQLGDWFRSGGNASVVEHLKGRVQALVPDLDVHSVKSAPCVTTFTASGYPAIGWQVPGRIAVLTGGCGAAAKSSDEIGRLGAELLFAGEITTSRHAAAFSPA